MSNHKKDVEKFIGWMRNHYACRPALRWIEKTKPKSIKQLYETCPYGSWMGWTFFRLSYANKLSPKEMEWLQETKLFRYYSPSIISYVPKNSNTYRERLLYKKVYSIIKREILEK